MLRIARDPIFQDETRTSYVEKFISASARGNYMSKLSITLKVGERLNVDDLLELGFFFVRVNLDIIRASVKDGPGLLLVLKIDICPYIHKEIDPLLRLNSDNLLLQDPDSWYLSQPCFESFTNVTPSTSMNETTNNLHVRQGTFALGTSTYPLDAC
ncbi:hypothetical protein TNCV_2522271 [Trichonephila clavipes]|nr:hypothetical protein TNCV_2522271 [Trichonephila clavipes]